MTDAVDPVYLAATAIHPSGGRRVRPRACGRVLDVGCGIGALVRVLAERTRGAEIVGLDPVPAFLDCARSRFSEPRVASTGGEPQSFPTRTLRSIWCSPSWCSS